MLLFVFNIFFSQEKDTAAIRFSKYISAEELKKNLSVLASDEYAGRETATEGQKKSAQFISEFYKKENISPGNKGSYYQQYPLLIRHNGGTDVYINYKKYEFLKDFFSFPGGEEQKIITKKALLVGYGITEKNYDDYSDKKVENKVVMALWGEPLRKDSTSYITGKKTLSDWSGFRKKAELARDKKAAALLIVMDDMENSIREARHFIGSPSMKLDMNVADKKEMPVIYISKEMANAILSGEKKNNNIDSIRSAISASGKPIAAKAKTNLVITTKEQKEKLSAENVLGFVEGSDLKSEIIVVSAHYDHLGTHDGKVFNGADDDGSGTVSVMQIAKAFEKAKEQGRGPRRSILFLNVSGEEKGLLGSTWYSENPVYPLDNTVTDLNIDMIGRVDEAHKDNPNYVYLIGADMLSKELNTVSEETIKTYSDLQPDYKYNDVKDKNRFYYRSDHYNFARKNIPVIFYFNGTHADYHKETDEIDKIDFSLMEKRARLVFFTAWTLANRTGRIKSDIKK